MRKTPILAAIVASALALSLPGFAAEGHLFVDGAVGKPNVSFSNTQATSEKNAPAAWRLLGGYRWQLSRGFAIGPELGYISFGQSRLGFRDVPVADQLLNGQQTLNARALLAGVNVRWSIGGGFYFTGHTGFASVYSQIRTTSVLTTASTRVDGTSRASQRSNNWYGGVGVGYDVSQNISLGVNYDRYRTGVRNASAVGVPSANIEFRF